MSFGSFPSKCCVPTIFCQFYCILSSVWSFLLAFVSKSYFWKFLKFLLCFFVFNMWRKFCYKILNYVWYVMGRLTGRNFIHGQHIRGAMLTAEKNLGLCTPCIMVVSFSCISNFERWKVSTPRASSSSLRSSLFKFVKGDKFSKVNWFHRIPALNKFTLSSKDGEWNLIAYSIFGCSVTLIPHRQL